MNCYPSQTATALAAPPSSVAATALSSAAVPCLQRAERLLAEHGSVLGDLPGFGDEDPQQDAQRLRSAAATALMDLYRASGSREAFDLLVEVAQPQLLARVRSRLRTLGSLLDPQEVLQDALVNVYRYPDRFLARHPGAFAAWSSTIIDNVIRRSLRRRNSGEVIASPMEILVQAADRHALPPDRQCEDREQACETARAFSLLLACYLAAFEQLADRERYVLHMVEVRQMRYAELAALLSIRPEALKMVVFRARRRLFERMNAILGS